MTTPPPSKPSQKAFPHPQSFRLRSLSSRLPKPVAYGLVYFFMLSSYSQLRSAATAVFLNRWGSQSVPLASAMAIGALAATVAILNWFQRRHSGNVLMRGVLLFSGLVFTATSLLPAQSPWISPLLFVTKEIYIVVLIQLFWAGVLTDLSSEQAKRQVSWIAAAGSVGGILGGFSVGWITKISSLSMVLYTAIGSLFLAAVLSPDSSLPIQEKPLAPAPKRSPIESLKGQGFFALVMLGLVFFSQFIMGLVDFRFNQELEAALPLVTEKAKRLGDTFAWINALTLTLKVFAIPLALRWSRSKWVHASTPLLYLAGFSIASSQGGLAVWNLFFVSMKSVDYSVFAAIKDFLYYALTPEQRYGLKYLVDMIGYRGSKAVAVILLLFFQSPRFVDPLCMTILSLWIALCIFVLPGILAPKPSLDEV